MNSVIPLQERRRNPSRLYTGMWLWARFGTVRKTGEIDWEPYRAYAFRVERGEGGEIVRLTIAGRGGEFNPKSGFSHARNLIHEETTKTVLEIEGMNDYWFMR